MKEKQMTLSLITPAGKSEPIACDSVHALLPDGLFGIRPGHEPALFVLRDGELVCFLNGAETAKITAKNAFLTVRDNSLELTAEEAQIADLSVDA